jgi:photosystem II stability/assembly factor-like uncharacterized protein
MRTQSICLALAIVLLCHLASAQWVQQNSGTTKNLYDVSFTDAKTGTVVGESGTILRTSDRGSTWTNQQVTSKTLRGVSFTDAIHGTVVGDSGTIFRTTNGGANWAPQSSGTTKSLSSVSFTDTMTGAAVGESGTILRTTDGGVTWMSQSSGTAAWLADVCFTDARIGTAVGDTVILRTTNGGTTWTCQANLGWDLRGVSFTNAMTGMVVGGVNLTSSPDIIRTTDGGNSWSRIGEGQTGWNFMISAPNGVCFTDENVGTVVGSSGHGWLGVIMHTTNGGTSWAEQAPTTKVLSSVCFTDEKNGTVVGAGGIILRTTNGGVTGVIDKSNGIPLSFRLKQNYPNPFNPSTTIKFELPKSSIVKLRVFDILGRQVSVLVNERKDAGVHELKFDGSNLSSGVYFYRLQVGDFVQTKKLVILK